MSDDQLLEILKGLSPPDQQKLKESLERAKSWQEERPWGIYGPLKGLKVLCNLNEIPVIDETWFDKPLLIDIWGTHFVIHEGSPARYTHELASSIYSAMCLMIDDDLEVSSAFDIADQLYWKKPRKTKRFLKELLQHRFVSSAPSCPTMEELKEMIAKYRKQFTD